MLDALTLTVTLYFLPAAPPGPPIMIIMGPPPPRGPSPRPPPPGGGPPIPGNGPPAFAFCSLFPNAQLLAIRRFRFTVAGPRPALRSMVAVPGAGFTLKQPKPLA